MKTKPTKPTQKSAKPTGRYKSAAALMKGEKISKKVQKMVKGLQAKGRAKACKKAKEVTLTWEYSRNQRRHTGYDQHGNELFQVVSNAPLGKIQNAWGYSLRCPGGAVIRFGSKTVAELKTQALSLANRNCARPCGCGKGEKP